ncbi:MAG TPA: hypothetical protein VMJ64_11855, partial [Anaerolineales bacterium]|nr:hypothetical protein [Anaerolineales bacterium]
ANLETNRFTINSYLGCVNLVSLFPSLLLVGGLIAAVLQVSRFIRHGELSISERGSLLFLLIVVCSMAGYFWYLLRYQNQGQGGDLIKATHMLQIFPFLALLSAQLLDRIDTRSHRAWLAIMILLGLIVLHNLPAMVTHYPIFP